MVAGHSRLLLALWMLFSPMAMAAAVRPLRVDDVLGARSLAQPFEYEAALAADGKGAAFAVGRAPASDPVGWSDNPLTHYDIYVQSAPGEPVVKITDGATDSSGWFEPQWSPDGRRLLMKSTRGGAINLWLWEPGLDRPRRLSSEPVDVRRRFDTVWLDDARILFCSRRTDQWAPEFLPVNEKQVIAGWAKAAFGVESSAIALSSSRSAAALQTSARLLLLDVSRVGAAVLAEGDVERFLLSPDNHSVAVSFSAVPRLEVRSVSGGLVFSEERPDAHFYLGSWSSSGQELTYWLVDPNVTELLRVTLPSKNSIKVSLEGLDPNVRRSPVWTADGRLLVEAAHSGGHGRSDWYLVDSKSPPRNLTNTLVPLAAPLYGSANRKSFLALAGGSLWKISTGEPPRVIAAHIESISAAYQDRSSDRADLLVRTHNGARFVDRRSFRLSVSRSRGTIAAWSTPSRQSISYVADRHDTSIYRNSELLLAINTVSSEIATGEVVPFEYRSLGGDNLRGCVLLPINYRANVHYPLLTYVYAGAIQQPSCDEMRAMATLGVEKPFLNMQLAASRGFAVLMPSMPLRSGGGPKDVLAELPTGVLPAVDKLIELGIADADRLFLLGHSFGGYSTYGLITQTPRFKAAVAISGYTDLISYYGSAGGRYRYSATPELMFFGMAEEHFNAALGAPPWLDRDRYVRNSPITFVDRVTTPLLLIHGDLDFVPIAQAEEFFAALFRQNKPAELVRYLGEGHLISSPANVRDLWTRLIAWLDQHGNIARDSAGNMIINGNSVQSAH